ncbi:MAG TPA: phosphoenolpyruvate carboxykinase domain-containing protein, partial [bacterium]|nr:phosphoenolpyruvate carboxykinase domain-containing protein [bacterium]
VYESMDWNHGVFMGASMASEKTAAAEGQVGELRRDPMAMLPFCGYHMGDYFAHWLKMGEKGGDKMPRIFYVNWFRKGDDGKFLWPGYGDNSRVLKWVFERCSGEGEAQDTAIGRLPAPGALDLDGLDLSAEAREKLFGVEAAGWKAEVPSMKEHFAKFGDRLPQGLQDELQALEKRLG